MSASMLEDIVERYYDDQYMGLSHPWRSFTQSPQVVGTIKDPQSERSPLRVYLQDELREMTLKEAIQARGNPFTWPAQLIRLLHKRLALGEALPHDAFRGSGLFDSVAEFHSIVSSVPIGNKSVSSVELHQIEHKLNSLFLRRPEFGSLNIDSCNLLIERAEQGLEVIDQFQSDISLFKRIAVSLWEQDVVLTGLAPVLQALTSIEALLRSVFQDRDALLTKVGEVRRLWPRFLMLHALARKKVRPPPAELTQLWLNDAQLQAVRFEHTKHYRISGASGSGKTLVLVQRAIRLALEHPDRKVLVVTLNRSLTRILADLVTAQTNGQAPANLKVLSLLDHLLDGNRFLGDIQGFRSIDTDRTKKDEAVLAIRWCEFFGGHGHRPHPLLVQAPPKASKKNKARGGPRMSLFESVRRRCSTDLDASRYLRDEMRYMRSACLPNQRHDYIRLERTGRGIPILESHRMMLLNSVPLFESWLDRNRLYDQEHLACKLAVFLSDVSLRKRYRTEFCCDYLLVDEAQDLSTVEARLLLDCVRDRNIQNAVFLAGDSAQQIAGRRLIPAKVGLSFVGRSRTLAANYRNTKEILRAAQVIARSYPPPPSEIMETVAPDLSSYDGEKPTVIAAGEDDQIALALALAQTRPGRRIGILSQNDPLLTLVFKKLKGEGFTPWLIVANSHMDEHVAYTRPGMCDARLTLADFGSSKGLEFDTVLLLDVSAGICPRASTPRDERWRDASDFYIAMTRARHELVIAHSDKPSMFLNSLTDRTVSRIADWRRVAHTTFLQAMETEVNLPS